ncbi:MAG: DUF4388 domain-containing protein [Candidatus Edwardsbacteria bacterium]
MNEKKVLGQMIFSEVVALATKEKWNGVLTIESPEVCEYVAFRDGNIAGFSSAERKKLIGDILTTTGRISQDDLQRALAIQRESQGQKRLGDVLVEMGMITRAQLEETIALHQMNVLSDCLSAIKGTLVFEEGATLADKG